MSLTLTSFDAALKDRYPLPGTRIKQYVVDERREAAWERETCPRVDMCEHDDNTGMPCANSARAVQWSYLDHHCCYTCGAVHFAFRNEERMVTWRKERDARPPICADESLLSDEIEPEWASMGDNALLKMMRKS